MTVKRYGTVSQITLSPKPSKDKAKSLLIRLSFQSRQEVVEIGLTSEAAMILMQTLEKFQKRYGWSAPKSRALTRRDLN